MNIRKGHELQDYTKLVSIQLLKVVKAEIENKRNYYKRSSDDVIQYGLNEALNIIDKHIADLSKGEEYE